MTLKAKRVDKAKKPKRRGPKRVELPEVELASKPSKAARKIENYSMWWYGIPGCGKTSLACEFPSSHLFLCDEDGGGKAIESHQRTVSHWLELVAYIQKLDGSEFKYAIIDTAEGAYNLCHKFMCEEVLFIDDPNDEKDYGASWNRIYTEFFTQMKALRRAASPIFISHASVKTFRPLKGIEYEGFRPAMRDKVLGMLLKDVDILGYMHQGVDGMVMQIRPDDDVLAKCRAKRQFRYTDGSRIKEIPLGNDEEEAYANVMKAFNNELKKPKERKLPRKKSA